MHESLENVVQQLLEQEEEQQLSQETGEAEEIRTPSDSEQSSSDCGVKTPHVSWWARLLQKHMPLPKDRIVPSNRPITIVSGCTGAGAEIAVFKASVRSGWDFCLDMRNWRGLHCSSVVTSLAATFHPKLLRRLTFHPVKGCESGRNHCVA